MSDRAECVPLRPVTSNPLSGTFRSISSLFVDIAQAGPTQWSVAIALAGFVGGLLIGFSMGRRSLATGRRMVDAVRRDRVGGAVWDDPAFWSELAEQAFAKARSRATWELLKAWVRGGRTCLLSFHEVVGDRLIKTGIRGPETIAISTILGSVDKPCAFTPSFLPRADEQKGRWKRAYALAHGLVGYEPIELYKVDGVHFVIDGHFRVSVIKYLGGESMEALVQEWS